MPQGPRHALRPAIALAAIAVLVFAGCGGSSVSSSPRSRMIAQADAICKPLNARRKAANKQAGTVTNAGALSKVAAIAPGLVTYERGVIADLRRLTAPSDLAADWRKILAGAELLAANTGKLGEAARTKNLKAVESLIGEDQASEKELIAVAKKAGFKHCGRNA